MSQSPADKVSDPERCDKSTPKESENDSGITMEFLQKSVTQEAIRNGTEVPTVLSYKVEGGTKPGDNYLSIIYSIHVELANSPKSKRHLLMKCYPTHPSRQLILNKINIFHKELQFYNEWIPELKKVEGKVAGLRPDSVAPLPFAPYVHGEAINFHSAEGKPRMSETFHSLDNFIIMEDIRKTSGFRMTERREPLDFDHMCLVVTALAKVHSYSWVYRQLFELNITEKFPCLKGTYGMEIWNNALFASLDRAKEMFDEEFGEGNVYSNGVDRYKTAHPTVCDFLSGKVPGSALEPYLASNPDPERFGKDAENPVDWKVISHGDCWSNNMLFKYDDSTNKPIAITLVDFQMAEETCVVNDLEYVVYVSTDRDLRNNHLNELLELYLDTFNGVCSLFAVPTLPGFNLESLKYRFHRAKLVGYFLANKGLPITLKEAEEVENFEEMDKGKELMKAFSEVSDNDSDVLRSRLIGIAQDMYDDGVL